MVFLLHFLYSYVRYGPEGPPQKLNADGEPVKTVGLIVGKAWRAWFSCLSLLVLAIVALVFVAVVWEAITG